MDYANIKRHRASGTVSLIVGFVFLLILNIWLVSKKGLKLSGIGIASSIGLLFQMLTIIAFYVYPPFKLKHPEIEFLGKETINGLFT